MLLLRKTHAISFIFIVLASVCSSPCRAQAALLMEEPYGFFGALNPTGHTAIYSAASLRRDPRKAPPLPARRDWGRSSPVTRELTAYDWVAIPLIPYLYSVEDASEVPAHVDRDMVTHLRDRYREAHLQTLGNHLSAGSFLHGGWNELVGVAYERRIYAFRFSDHRRAGRRPHRATEFQAQPFPFQLSITTARTLRASCSTPITRAPSAAASSLMPA